ncbi:MAG TPA: type II toxin-antitoxin system prevent-host-death family antitoxin [Nitrospiria bacterium]|jgi:prevent-host-death family protein
MSIVGVKELKNRLTQYLRKTKQGEKVIVTERGKPIAVISSSRGALPATSIEMKLADLEREGRIRLPQKKFLKKLPSIRISGLPISDTLLEDRG